MFSTVRRSSQSGWTARTRPSVTSTGLSRPTKTMQTWSSASPAPSGGRCGRPQQTRLRPLNMPGWSDWTVLGRWPRWCRGHSRPALPPLPPDPWAPKWGLPVTDATKRVGVGVIGVGGMGAVHLGALARCQGADLVAIADQDTDALKTAEADRPSAHPYQAYQDLIADPAVDLVDVALPHYLHSTIAREALLAGKDVVTEKPLALNAQDGDHLLQLAQSRRRRLFVKAYQRASTLARVLKEECTPAGIAQPRLITAHFQSRRQDILADPANWRAN